LLLFNPISNFKIVKITFAGCIHVLCHFHPVVPPVLDDQTKPGDIYVNTGKPIFLVLPCSVKKSYPPPDVFWLHNGIPLDDVLFNATIVQSNFSLIITSRNSSYEFVYEHIIGMYQCFISNKAGHTVDTSRIVFICKSVYILLVTKLHAPLSIGYNVLLMLHIHMHV